MPRAIFTTMSTTQNILLGSLLLFATVLMPLSAYADSVKVMDESPCQMTMVGHDIADSHCLQLQCEQCTGCTACSHCYGTALITDTGIASSSSFESVFLRFSVNLYSLYPLIDSPPPRLG